MTPYIHCLKADRNSAEDENDILTLFMIEIERFTKRFQNLEKGSRKCVF
jgi:hypothetical protein